MTISETIYKAINYLEEWGWKQGGYGAEDGPTCAGIAIEKFDNEKREAEFFFAEFIGEKGDAGDSTVFWNDRPGRTYYEVIDTMRDAALAAFKIERENLLDKIG